MKGLSVFPGPSPTNEISPARNANERYVQSVENASQVDAFIQQLIQERDILREQVCAQANNIATLKENLEKVVNS